MEDEKYEVHWFAVDENYIECMGLDLMAGTNFPENMSTENEKFIIVSEMALDHFQLGTPHEAIGSSLILGDSTLVEIIGVIKDFQHLALFLNQRPVLLRYVPSSYHHAFLRLASPHMPSTMDKLERTWGKIDPYHEMDGDFIDGRLKHYYSFFEDIIYTVGFATILAILIAAFGMLGMATYSTRTRYKEIGIRKVFGAKVNHIVLLISRSYLWLMLIAAVIGGIIAYLVNNLWLQYLSKSVEFGMSTILAGVFLVVLAGLLTIKSPATAYSLMPS